MSEQFLSSQQVIEMQDIVQRARERIADLERQLAEAQGKLDAVEAWANGLTRGSKIKARLLRILHPKEGNE